MKVITKIITLAMAAALPAALTSCSNNDEPSAGGGDVTADGRFVFATQVQGSNATSNVLVTGESLDEGTVTTVNNGLLNDGATQWVFYKNYLYALTYNQGNAGTTRSYILGADGQMEARGKEFRISRFSSYGTYGDDIITTATGFGPQSMADAKGYVPMVLNITYLDVANETSSSNTTGDMSRYVMENYLGNGEYVTLAGLESRGEKIFSGAVPMGLSQYGAAADGGKWILPGNEHLVHSESGGQGSGAYNAGELSGTQYPNECWVAVFDNKDLLNPKFAHTDRISYPCGRFRSQYYQTVWKADNGDIYVFSSSYAKTMSDKAQQTTLPAGVCRIPSGSTDFDDYYCNLEAQTPGGDRSFMRCWPAGGNSFLMQMYDGPITKRGVSATELAVFDASAKKLTYVTGLPENVSSIGKTVYTANGKVYIPVNVKDAMPAIYAIDVKTAQAVKGVTVEATDINGFGYLTPKK